MAENMVLSFDGTKLFVNKEVDMDCRAVCVIVHGLCEHQVLAPPRLVRKKPS